jgi:hypothetical protein
VLTARREYSGSPGLATSRIANSCWYMMMAARNAGLVRGARARAGGGARGHTHTHTHTHPHTHTGGRMRTAAACA